MVREYTLSNTGNIAAGSNSERYLTWTHEGTSQYVLENMQLQFVVGYSRTYKAYAYESVDGRATQRLNTDFVYAGAGTTVTVALDRAAWANRTGGSLTFKFYAPSSGTNSYRNIKVILTYRAVAEPSTITVETAIAGDPQTVRITNTDPDVYHTVTWSYGPDGYGLFRNILDEMDEIELNGNVELWNRPRVTAAAMIEAGYTEFEEGDYATLYSMTYTTHGDTFTALLSPIRADGAVFSPTAMDAYFKSITAGAQTTEAIIANDAQEKKLLMHVVSGEHIDHMEEVAIQAHELSAMWEETVDEYGAVTRTNVLANTITSGKQTYNAATRSPAWAVPAGSLTALFQASPNSAAVMGTVTVVTFTGDGTQVGTTTADAELLLPETETTKPAITATEMTGTPDTVAQHIAAVTGNQWVEEHTTATYSVTAAGYQGATITRIRVLTPDGSLTLSSGTGSAVVRTAGRYAVGLEVEDSRGFIRTVTEQWVLQEVQAYHQPIITSLQAIRCDSSGQETEDGGHVWVEASAVLADIAHTLTLRAAIREKGGSQIGTKAVMTGGTVILGGNLSEEITYVVTVEAEDEYGLTDEAEIEIGTGIITFSRLTGGKGVAFGKAAERYGVEIREEWPFFTHGQEILRLVVDIAHPPGSILETADAAFDPNTQWPWTVWGKLGSGKWARGV